MSNETNIVLSERRELTPQIWTMIREMAPVMHQSRLFGVASESQAAAIMLKGFELGLPITSSFEFIHVIDGKPTLSPRGALALLTSQGILDAYKLNRLTDKAGAFVGYECFMKRRETEFTSRFTMEDAKRAQLTEGSPTSNGKRGYGNWEKYPENMCMWRAIGFCADVIAPDVTGGLTTYLKMPEAFDIDVNDEGDFIPAHTEPQITTTPTLGEAIKIVTLNHLVDSYGADRVMAANGGMIPGTQEEINLIAAVLEEEDDMEKLRG